MLTSSSETLIGWKSGKPLLPLYRTEWRERGCGLELEFDNPIDIGFTTTEFIFSDFEESSP